MDFSSHISLGYTLHVDLLGCTCWCKNVILEGYYVIWESEMESFTMAN